MKYSNPFPLIPYTHPDYFCDRENEVKMLEEAFINDRNTVLIALRRIGKTGLIKHLFKQLETSSAIKTVYVDIMDTYSVDEFVNILASKIMQAIPSKSKRWYSNFVQSLSGLNPILTFDPQTGVPSIELQLHSEQQQKGSIEKIVKFLESQPYKVLIAIDEFQQITHYNKPGFEAFLRSQIQHLSRCSFIFSGSEQHILSEMFNTAAKPFYQSADYLKLERISIPKYAQFIVAKFAATKKEIAYEEAYELIEWLDCYTFYVQNFFNKLWFISRKTVKSDDIDAAKQQVLNERQYMYTNLRKLLTSAQYLLLKAIAIKGSVTQPTSFEFVTHFKLGTTSTVNSALKALQQKELIYYEHQAYKVYDVFLEKWFQRKG
jgi:AAA+ ATPase superfamily predicted ATPase